MESAQRLRLPVFHGPFPDVSDACPGNFGWRRLAQQAECVKQTFCRFLGINGQTACLLRKFATVLVEQQWNVQVRRRGQFKQLLQQSPPAEIAVSGPAEIWAWAAENWDPQRLRGLHKLFTPSRP